MVRLSFVIVAELVCCVGCSGLCDWVKGECDGPSGRLATSAGACAVDSILMELLNFGANFGFAIGFCKTGSIQY